VTARHRVPAGGRPLPRDDGLRALARAMREVPDGTGRVVSTARELGWLVNHQRPAQTERGWRTATQGHAGFPDLVLAHPAGGVVVVVELKRWAERRDGTRPADSLPTAEQDRWLRALHAAPGVYATCWDTLDIADGTVAALLADPAELARRAALPYQPKETDR
jgi:hypothetical protein